MTCPKKIQENVGHLSEIQIGIRLFSEVSKIGLLFTSHLRSVTLPRRVADCFSQICCSSAQTQVFLGYP